MVQPVAMVQGQHDSKGGHQSAVGVARTHAQVDRRLCRLTETVSACTVMMAGSPARNARTRCWWRRRGAG